MTFDEGDGNRTHVFDVTELYNNRQQSLFPPYESIDVLRKIDGTVFV